MSLLLFSTAAYEYLRDAMSAVGGYDVGEVERCVFPDGERYQRLLGDCLDRDVAVVGGTITDADTLELYDLASAIVGYGAARLSVIIPYYGHSTMERAVKIGEISTAKTRARLLSAIPAAGMGNRVFLLDLHVASTAHYFEGAVRPVHVYGKPVISAALRRLGGTDFVLACTDAGRAKWVESLANDLEVTAAFAYKRRISGEKTEVSGVSAHVSGRRVIIYDDMIRTGGSLLGAARAYREAGAASIAAVATHGVFPGQSLQRLQAAKLFETIVCTDSHPRAQSLAGEFLVVDSIAALLVEQLERNR